MCFYFHQSKTATELEHRFNTKSDQAYMAGSYNGFEHPKAAVITSQNRHLLQQFQWGLIPSWSKNDEIKNHTLNARIESLHEKRSFRDILQQRCLIPATSFFEWQWLDSKGKNKQKYNLHLPESNCFSFAGIWSEWVNPEGKNIATFTIITTEANELMSQIHNTKKRMPIIIAQEAEDKWLNGEDLIMQNDYLIGEKMNPPPPTLFD